MSLKIGSGWTKNTKDNQTFISYSINEEILELYPCLKELRITSFHIPKEERKNENSPSWSLVIKKKQENTTNSTEEDEEEIPI